MTSFSDDFNRADGQAWTGVTAAATLLDTDYEVGFNGNSYGGPSIASNAVQRVTPVDGNTVSVRTGLRVRRDRVGTFRQSQWAQARLNNAGSASMMTLRLNDGPGGVYHVLLNEANSFQSAVYTRWNGGNVIVSIGTIPACPEGTVVRFRAERLSPTQMRLTLYFNGVQVAQGTTSVVLPPGQPGFGAFDGTAATADDFSCGDDAMADAPTGLTATVDGTRVALAWGTTGLPMSWATGIIVQRSADNGDTWTTLTTVPSDRDTPNIATGYTDEGLAAGTYLYRIACHDDTDTSPWSATASATIVPSVTPDPPTGLAVTTVSATALALAWEPVAGAAYYLVERDGDLVGFALTPAFTDTGLAPATEYSYRVRAVGGTGAESAWSTAAQGTTRAGGTLSPWVPPADTLTTDSTAALYASLRATLLAYVDPDVSDPAYQLAALLAAGAGQQARLFVRAVPNVNDVRYPYVALLLDRGTTDGSNSYREQATLEVQVVGNPAAQGPLVEWIADRIDRCLLSLRLSSPSAGPGTDYGLVTCRARQRATMPPFTTPADGNTYGVRMTFDLVLWPRVLTQGRAEAPSP